MEYKGYYYSECLAKTGAMISGNELGVEEGYQKLVLFVATSSCDRSRHPTISIYKTSFLLELTCKNFNPPNVKTNLGNW